MYTCIYACVCMCLRVRRSVAEAIGMFVLETL